MKFFCLFFFKFETIKTKKKVSKNEAQSWCERNRFPYFECSAKEEVNVEQAFHTVGSLALRQYEEQNKGEQ